MFDRLIEKVSKRAPDFVIGDAVTPYLKRWWLIPRNRFFNIYLHNILRSDDDRALHDHPWWNVSIILRGYYREVTPTAGATTVTKFRARGSFVFRWATTSHRLIISDAGEPTWSLFITGPVLRTWGFWCPKGWVRWQEFVTVDKGVSVMSRGCGED